MCEFLSVIVLRNGDILRDELTDSHEHLIGYYGLDDSKEPSLNRFVRVEFKPDDRKDYDTVAIYVLRVDEYQTPAWFEEHREDVTSKLKAIIKRMILKDVTKKYLLSGTYILTGKTKIDYCVNTRIAWMGCSSKVGVMWGTSKVGEMWETSNVGVMRGTSNVGVMWGTSKVGEMWETSNVGVMWGTSKQVIGRDYRVAVS